MNIRQVTILFFLLLIFSLGVLNYSSLKTLNNPHKENKSSPHIDDLSCTIFSIDIGNKVLFGNNEDYKLWGTYIWFVPTHPGRYGAVYFGFQNNSSVHDGHAQGGMNSWGLCVDGNGLPMAHINAHPEKPRPAGFIMESVLEECATVNQTISWFQNHNFGDRFSGQAHFADAYGNSVVVSPGSDGELAFTRKNNSKYLVSTNFNLANVNHGYYPCWRYDTAVSMIEAIHSEEDLTIAACRDILDAVHAEGEYFTKYSNIFDLKSREIYVYHLRNFTEYIKLNLTEELAQGEHMYRISDLFNYSYPTSTISSNYITSTTSAISSMTNTAVETTDFLTIEVFIIFSGRINLRIFSASFGGDML
ncbi:MAG: carcinine hydrolase/isopenicillin-N N-acyltransferase family protein, partial [Candidatus Hodarchaeota archaeon]